MVRIVVDVMQAFGEVGAIVVVVERCNPCGFVVRRQESSSLVPPLSQSSSKLKIIVFDNRSMSQKNKTYIYAMDVCVEANHTSVKKKSHYCYVFMEESTTSPVDNKNVRMIVTSILSQETTQKHIALFFAYFTMY